MRDLLVARGAPHPEDFGQIALNAFANGSPKFVIGEPGKEDIVVTCQEAIEVLGHGF